MALAQHFREALKKDRFADSTSLRESGEALSSFEISFDCLR